MNKALAEKTALIQQEFDLLMEQMIKNRDEKEADTFYEIMAEMNGRGKNQPKHEIPTMRLIQ